MEDENINKWERILGMGPPRDRRVAAPEPRRPTEQIITDSARPPEHRAHELKSIGEGLPSDFNLTDEFKAAFYTLENGPQLIFVTGRAGTGKSTLLRFFRLNTAQQIAVVAPTGVAALNVSGQTIHSFFRFPPRPIATTEIKQVRDRRLYRSVDILVIDEISMVRADVLDGIDQFMRINGRNKDKPFGGARVIMFGDPYQLPPVISSREESAFLDEHYESPHFFSANVFAATELTSITLMENFRQKEIEFMDLLDQIRIKSSTYEAITILNTRCLLPASSITPEESIVLTTTNKRADQINKSKLEELGTKEFSFDATVTGDFLKGSKKRYPAPESLRLRKGAHVMFVRNSPDHDYVNGTMGVITSLSKNHIEVLVRSAKGDFKTDIETATWESFNYKYDPAEQSIKAEAVGTFTQYPVILAWATTIHKSQGKTFDRVTLDVTDRAFACGQVYVALSRCRTLDGLSLRVPLKTRDIMVEVSVQAFLNRAAGGTNDSAKSASSASAS